MTDSAFNRSLDALVRGESSVGNHELAGFATDLYRKEQDVIMPAGTKSTIASRLGLDPGAESAHAAPVSRRTTRAKAHQREYARRPWFTVAAVAIAFALAMTGILQWSLPSGNDGDNRFSVLSPAVPTVDATPSASPVVDATCDIDTFEPDYEIEAAGPVNIRPGPGVDSGDAILALPVGSEVMYLCESQGTSDPAIDDLEPGELWMKVRTEDGDDGWIREIDLKLVPEAESTAVRPTAESRVVPMGGDNRVTPVPTASFSNDIVPMEDSPYPTPAPMDDDNRGSFTPTPAEEGVEIEPLEIAPTPSG